MKTLLITLAALCAAVSAMAVEGQKLDSGLGDLPPYSQWADKTGGHPVAVRVPGESLDDGLGDLPDYSHWLDKSGRDPLGREGVRVADGKR